MRDNCLELLGRGGLSVRRGRIRGATADLAREVAAWLEEHWDPALSVEEWWRLVGRRGVERAPPPA